MFGAGSLLLMMSMGMVMDVFGLTKDEEEDPTPPPPPEPVGDSGGETIALPEDEHIPAEPAPEASSEGPIQLTAEDMQDLLAIFGKTTPLFAAAGGGVAVGDDQDNTIQGSKGNDLLVGNDGDDLLAGDEGIDRILGGEGNDNIFLDTEDTVTGGAGSDAFILGDWMAGAGTAAEVDDFDPAEDQFVVLYDPDAGPAPTIRLEEGESGTDIFADDQHVAHITDWMGGSTEDVVVLPGVLDAF
jgi:hypothetical protein